MAYYHDLITEESWQELQTLQKNTTFVLMGGWALYLYTHALKSKDIDILVEYNELSKLVKQYQLSKNDRLLPASLFSNWPTSRNASYPYNNTRWIYST